MKTDNIHQIIKKAAVENSILSFLCYREYLKTIYKHVKSEVNGTYSYLAFADHLGFSKTNVIRLVIIGQRPLTLKAGAKISKSLGLKGPERLFFENLIKHANSRNPVEREKYFKNLVAQKEKIVPEVIDKHLISYFSNWLNSVVRESVSLASIKADPNVIKEKLIYPARLDEIKKSVALLEELELISKGKDGKYQVTKKDVTTTRQVNSLSIINYHQQMLDIAKQSITRVDEDKREILALTVRLTSDDYEIAKEKVYALMREIHEMESKSGGDIFQFNTQLFPFFK